jgi:hypothetical protein
MRIKNLEMNIQGGHVFGTKFAMENEYMLWSSFPAHAGSGLVSGSTKEVLL